LRWWIWHLLHLVIKKMDKIIGQIIKKLKTSMNFELFSLETCKIYV
jgi:hypothetical protein